MHGHHSRRGVTLLELLLVLVIISLIGSAFVASSLMMFRTPLLDRVENLLVSAQQESRLMAVENRQVYRLVWDERGNRFALLDTQVVQDFVLEGDLEGEKISISFWQPSAQEAGQGIDDLQWHEVESMTLYPDGTAAPTKVLMQVNDLELTLEFEAFSGLVWERPAA